MLTGPKSNRRSNAKNAYDLMTDCRRYMLEEPKRVNMSDYIIRGERSVKRFLKKIATDMYSYEDEHLIIPKLEAPACNTVACIAGSALMLTGRGDLKRNPLGQSLDLLGGREPRIEWDNEAVDYIITGPDNSDLRWELEQLFIDTDVNATYGTMKYAKIVAKRVKDFQQAHRKELKQVKVTRFKKRSKS